jgi:1,2-diacylglycerol 3-alpha-glucosyltransferase
VNNKYRVVGLVTNIVPYHNARWQAFAALPEIDCTLISLAGRDEFPVLECAPNGLNLYSRHILFDSMVGRAVPVTPAWNLVQQQLSDLKPHVVCLNGYASIHSRAALHWSVSNSVPTVLCSESSESDADRNPFKEWVKRRLVTACTAGLAGGTPQAVYLERLGLPRNRIFIGYDIVDNPYFIRKVKEVRDRSLEVRSRYALPEQYFLASARFIEKKNLAGLLQAYAQYRGLCDDSKKQGMKRSKPWDLVLLGDGKLRASLLALRASLGLDACVHMPGAKSYAELPAYYGLAEAFVHASTTEQWGLVVNEAMASGLPVLVSNRCGCASDLVQEDRNGFTFDPHDSERLAKLMLKLSLMSDRKLRELGINSQRIIAHWGPEAFAIGMRQAVEVALHQPPQKVSHLDKLVPRLPFYR